MDKLILKTSQTTRANRKVNFGGNIVEFNRECECEVTDKDVAKLLIESYGLELTNKEDVITETENAPVEPETEESKPEETEAETEKETVGEDKEEENETKAEEATDEEDLVKLINSKSKKELIELCKDFGFPNEEWEGLNAGDLKSYMIKKSEK